MSAEVMQNISIIAFVLAAILAVIALILWFRFDIKEIIDELSSKKVERRILELREQNRQEEADNKGRAVYTVPSEKATLKLKSEKEPDKTDKLSQMSLSKGRRQAVDDELDTAKLIDDEIGTSVLDDEEMTTVLSLDENATTVLSEEEVTTVLAGSKKLLKNGYYLILDEIVVHTKERI